MNFWRKIAEENHLVPPSPSPYGAIGMIYPNLYSVGMASLGYQQVMRLFLQEGFSVERIFLDKKGRETRSIENHTPLFRFPILAASYTYELDIVNLVKMLLNGGVAPLAKDRDQNSPLLIFGGQAASSNPRLLEKIADVVVLGEAEGLIQTLAPILARLNDRNRDALLEELSHIDHLYVPKYHGSYDDGFFRRHFASNIDASPSHSVILAPEDEFGGAFLLEVSRGCHYRCNFCIVHYMNGRARYRDSYGLIQTLEQYKEHYHKVGLLGAAVADHPQVEDLAEWLVQRGKQVSTSSLRAEKLSERFLDLLRDGGQHTITVAPETGATESRRRMRKGVKDEKYFQLAEMAGKRGFPYLKLYFLIGCPDSEPMMEANEIIPFTQTMNEIFSKSGGGKVVATVSPFVPKPTTPWGGEVMWEAKKVKKASRIIRKELAFRGNIKVRPVNVKEARAETVLTWAGSEITDDLLQLAADEISLESAFQHFDLAHLPRTALGESVSAG